MYNKNLIEYAILHKEWYTVAFLLDQLASEFLEGDIYKSRLYFNNLFCIVPLEAILILKDTSVFDCVIRLCDKRIEYEVGRQVIPCN